MMGNEVKDDGDGATGDGTTGYDDDNEQVDDGDDDDYGDGRQR